MADILITSDKSVVLKTKGTFCDKDVMVKFTGEGTTPAAPVLQDKTVVPTESKQEVTADTEYDGLRLVTVESIPSEYVKPTEILTVSSNGTYDVKNCSSIIVDVPSPVLEELNVTNNNTYTPPSGVDGYNRVVVNVESGGSSNNILQTIGLSLTYLFVVYASDVAAKDGGSVKRINIETGEIDEGTSFSFDYSDSQPIVDYLYYSPRGLVTISDHYGGVYDAGMIYVQKYDAETLSGLGVYGNPTTATEGVEVYYPITGSTDGNYYLTTTLWRDWFYSGVASYITFTLSDGTTMSLGVGDHGNGAAITYAHNGVTSVYYGESGEEDSEGRTNVITGIDGLTLTKIIIGPLNGNQFNEFNKAQILTDLILNLPQIFNTTNQ